MNAHDAEPRRAPRGGACVAHTFAAHVRACPGLVWAALTDADKTAAYLHGLAAHSTQIPGAPISFCLGDRTELIGRLLHAQWPRTAVVLRAASRAARPAHVPDLADQADTGRVHDPGWPASPLTLSMRVRASRCSSPGYRGSRCAAAGLRARRAHHHRDARCQRALPPRSPRSRQPAVRSLRHDGRDARLVFIPGRAVIIAMELNAAIYDRYGSISQVAFSLPVLRILARRSPRVRRFFDLTDGPD